MRLQNPHLNEVGRCRYQSEIQKGKLASWIKADAQPLHSPESAVLDKVEAYRRGMGALAIERCHVAVDNFLPRQYNAVVLRLNFPG